MATQQKPQALLEAEVEKVLLASKLKYEKEAVLGQARPDFVVTTDTGEQVVVEVKDWERNPETTARALNQARLYKELSKAAASLVILPAAAALGTVVEGARAIASPAGLIAALGAVVSAATKGGSAPKPAPTQPAPKRTIFVSMPFAPKYDDTFLVAIEPSALKNNAVAERVDHNGAAGPIVPQIYNMIKAAKAVVADLSESRPNVLHEIGYAEALGKPVVQICSTTTSSLPFNVSHNQTIPYDVGQTSRLRKRLETELAKYL